MRAPSSLVVVVVVALLCGCMSDGRESEIGEAAAAEVAARFEFLPETSPAHRFAAALLEPLAEAARPVRDMTRFGGYRLRVLDADFVNAFALPAGRLFVTKGLLREVRSCAELAAVLGHEIAHAARRHGPAREADSRFVAWFSRIFLADSTAAIVPQLVGAVLQGTVYSRADESEADALGLRIAAAAGYEPAAAIEFFERDATGPGGAGSFFDSHPAHGERIATLKAVIAEQGLAPGVRDCVAGGLTLPAVQHSFGRIVP